MSHDLEAERRDLKKRSRWLHGSGHTPVHVELERVAAWCRDHDLDGDRYGDGEHLQAFEARVASMLGYPVGRFLPSGTMAQQAAMRVWCDRQGISRFGMHPTAHLELHEERGYERLHGLSSVLIGSAERPLTVADLDAAPELMSALIVELPTRENGGQLADWPDLVELCAAARDRGIKTHLDGARLWEAAAGYERPPAEICELFDSTYVSFYKGIGALPGSMLLGPADFVNEAKLWQHRQGGSLYTLVANWASADMLLDEQIAKMPAYRARAAELVVALADIDGLRINPNPPHVNMFHVFIEGGAEDELLEARDRVAHAHGLWLFGGLSTTEVPGVFSFEVAVSDAAMELDPKEVAAAFASLV